MIVIEQYCESRKDEWDLFCNTSKMPLFMFNRKYMEYHSDRFIDYSLMFYEDEELIALLPATKNENTIISHGGLTYGGLITSSKMKQHLMIECFDKLKKYCHEHDIEKVIYKTIPHIFHIVPAEEDRYALYVSGAKLAKIEASTVVDLDAPQKMPKGRKAQISRAKREGVIIKQCNLLSDFLKFIELENAVLDEHHNTKAVHTGEELYLLYSRFPDQIHLYAAFYQDEMIAGTVIFEYPNVIHTQYMASNDVSRMIGGLDLVIKTVIDDYSKKKKWLDFGISTENNGLVLNAGLISQKEGFGGRTNIYSVWELII